MKKLTQSIIICFSLSILPSFTLAEDKIAVINMQGAVLTTQFARQQQKTLNENTEYKKLVERLQQLKVDLQTLEENANNWSAEQKTEHTNKTADYQQVTKQIDLHRNKVGLVIKKQFEGAVKEVIDKIIKEEGITLLLNAKAAYFAAPGYDITKKVAAALDARHQTGAN